MRCQKKSRERNKKKKKGVGWGEEVCRNKLVVVTTTALGKRMLYPHQAAVWIAIRDTEHLRA